MKHFEISIKLVNHYFSYTCMTVYEGINAIADIYTSLGDPCFHADGFIEILMDMKNGKKLTFTNHRLIIRYVDGEV